MERENKIKALYAAISTESFHREYCDRFKFLRGWSGQKIAAILKKVCTYHVDHPEVELSHIYAQAFQLRVNGEIPQVANF